MKTSGEYVKRYGNIYPQIYDMDNLTELTISQEPYRTADGWLIYKNQIVQEADTIEELCDEFVIIKEHRPVITQLDYLDFQEHKQDLIGQKVMGAIWTDKGLIYVAKMNEEGVLELL